MTLESLKADISKLLENPDVRDILKNRVTELGIVENMGYFFENLERIAPQAYSPTPEGSKLAVDIMTLEILYV